MPRSWPDSDARTSGSLKAGTPEGFEARTGASGRFWHPPYVAVEYLPAVQAGFHVAAITDPRLMPRQERAALLARLRRAGYRRWDEEEDAATPIAAR